MIGEWLSEPGPAPVRKPAVASVGFWDAGERALEVFLDVVRQRLQRRDVDHLRLVGECAFDALPYQPIDRGKKRGQRLARPGWRGDQHVAALADCRPRLLLRAGRRREA